ncbi:MAG: hypothetical protein FJZ95_00030 [Chloroflexi bacterium]|nr:hypothetical protein [Chloroflexota bacterium]
MIRKPVVGLLLLVLSLNALALASNPQPIRAAAGDPGSPQSIINEFMSYAASGDWVELYNPSDVKTNLGGWTLADSTSVMKTLSSGDEIPAHSWLQVFVSNRLDRSGDKIILKNSAGIEVDRVAYGGIGNAPTPGDGQSTGRCPDGHDTDVDGMDFRVFIDPTPRKINVTEVCDGLDNDCDGLIDADDPSCTGVSTYYADADDDGLGDPATSIRACIAPTGYVLNSDDMCPDTPGSSPTGCIPESPAVVLASSGMLTLGAILWLKRRHGSALIVS